MTKVFKNLTSKIIGWKVYSIGDGEAPFLYSNIWQGSKGGDVNNAGVIESDWAEYHESREDYVNHGIHVYLDKKDAVYFCSYRVIVQVEIDPEDVLAVGAYSMNDSPHKEISYFCDFYKKTIPITLVAKKVTITQKEFDKATKNKRRNK